MLNQIKQKKTMEESTKKEALVGQVLPAVIMTASPNWKPVPLNIMVSLVCNREMLHRHNFVPGIHCAL